MIFAIVTTMKNANSRAADRPSRLRPARRTSHRHVDHVITTIRADEQVVPPRHALSPTNRSSRSCRRDRHHRGRPRRRRRCIRATRRHRPGVRSRSPARYVISPPEDGYRIPSLTQSYASSAVTSPATRNESQTAAPAITAACPRRAKMPAPTMRRSRARSRARNRHLLRGGRRRFCRHRRRGKCSGGTAHDTPSAHHGNDLHAKLRRLSALGHQTRPGSAFAVTRTRRPIFAWSPRPAGVLRSQTRWSGAPCRS